MTVAATSIQGMGLGRHEFTGRGQIFIQPRASAVFEPGSAVVHRAGVQLAEVPLSATPRTDLVTLGRFVGQSTYTAPSAADANGGAVDASGAAVCITVTPFSGAGTGWFATGSGVNQITAAAVDLPCFWYDDDTLYLTDASGTLSFAGYVAAVEAATGRIAVKSDEQMRCLYELYSAGQSAASGATATQDDTVRAVASSLPAGTFSSGVLTLTATGAFATAQNGVTLAVGDKFIIPAGTITTLVVSAANSGVYEVTGLGSTGVSATFTRSAKWAHGAIITPGTKIRMSGEGTLFNGSLWTADPATAAKVVGTDDPVLYPDKVTQAITLIAGVAAVTNVPIKSATKTQFQFARTTANTSTATTGGYHPFSIVAGGLGTATVTETATVAAGTLNNADISTGNFTILN